MAGRTQVLVSAHVLTGRGQQLALAECIRMAKDLAGDRPCIVGGDFNASLHWPEYRSWFFVGAAGTHL
jgi:endonuclease/exonuclease/phosphatase family metal-dependent hydrolase